MPLLFSFGVVDVALELVDGVADVEELVLPDDGDAFVSDDDEDDGGVPVALDDEDGVDAEDDDVSDGLVLGVVDDEDDDIDPLVAGGVVVDDDEDVDGDGVTTGGVVLVVDDVSRLHPAMPRTSPLTSSVTSAVFIAISKELIKGCPPADLADSMP